MKRNNRRSNRIVALPTPIHHRFSVNNNITTVSAGTYSAGFVMVSLPDETTSNTGYPRSLLLGNFNLACTIDVGSSFLGVGYNYEVALMKIPKNVTFDASQGYQQTMIQDHPEWVLCHKYIGRASDSSTGQQYQPVRISSRRKCRLFTGDRLMLVVTVDKSGVALNSTISGVFTCKSRLD
jgi:hypothetical protein